MMRNQVANLVKQSLVVRRQCLVDARWRILPYGFAQASSGRAVDSAFSRGYAVMASRSAQLQELDRSFRSQPAGVEIWRSVANKVRLQSGVTMPVQEEHDHQDLEKRTWKNPADIVVSQYWGIMPKKIVREDGTVWPWNCFKPTDVHLTDLSIDLSKHHKPESIVDKIALWTVKSLRVPTDIFFQKRYGCRAMMLETVAAVPGMVGGMLLHLKSLRRFEQSGGWIKALLEEAENERMHLMTFMEVAKPAWYERALVIAVQGIFFNAYFLLYLASPRMAHRIVGYLEEEAIYSYTSYLEEIDRGHLPNVPAPAIAIDYWRLPKDATIRDVVAIVRADEAHHRDVNHFAADIKKHGMELREAPAPLEYH
ncbi:hypothetical protein O6H91_19G048500 [Diphasiastrum complanatum]|uniref:Uncharacterized protein n=1 Tax=Diphasiastrum complanatum TaxID=34168 RepID=A0ACC2AUZ0_DIPCM|nr:hypothetical protein O6H91_19G048500 [Diphasiastrum complanatum]